MRPIWIHKSANVATICASELIETISFQITVEASTFKSAQSKTVAA